MVDDLIKLLSRSLRLTYRTRVLWVIGMVGALLGGLGSVSSGLTPVDLVFFAEPNRDELFGLPDLAPLLLLYDALSSPGVFWSVAGFGMAVGTVGLFIGSLAEAALIATLHRAALGPPVPWQEAFAAGWRRVGPVFVIRLVIGVSIVVPIFVPIASAFALTIQRVLSAGVIDPAEFASLFGLLFACLIPLMCLFVAVSILFRWIEILSLRAAVLEGMGVFAAIRRAWQVLRANAIRFIGWWIVVGLGQLGLSALLARPVVLLSRAVLPRLDLAGLLAGAVPAPSELASVAAGAGLAWLLAGVMGGLLHAYLSAFWTLAYDSLLASLVGQLPRGPGAA